MEKCEQLIHELKNAEVDVVCGLPCASLKKLILEFEKGVEDITYLPLTREEEGIGICAGIHFGQKRAVMLIQNSGLGNSANAIASLSNYYDLPLVFLISQRGGETEKIDAQKCFGKITKNILEILNIECIEVNKNYEVSNFSKKINESFKNNKRIAFLIDPGFW